MTTPISVRFPEEVARRLRGRSAGSGEATSGLVVRLVDEGMRMAEHPGIVFRDGPAGRRAALSAGPDVWEIMVVLKDFASGGVSEAIGVCAKSLGLTELQVRVAEHYYANYPQEIDGRIGLNTAAAERAQHATEVRRRLYA
ncbi:MAG: hypothetical protein M3P52_01785 [Actinomycetota bacterium]|nr:hypothetical protein [Actinomycetota bacterium]